jgi:hypothetical protein
LVFVLYKIEHATMAARRRLHYGGIWRSGLLNGSRVRMQLCSGLLDLGTIPTLCCIE